ncbi:hypothetical protein [Paraburkholderia sp.]|nr:hypothetical protein [Paraburkholderia sp.]MDE1184270.1 hypothetical protein [Paraburkholderia sp.]
MKLTWFELVEKCKKRMTGRFRCAAFTACSAFFSAPERVTSEYFDG